MASTEAQLKSIEGKIDAALLILDTHRTYLYGDLDDEQKMEASVRSQLTDIKKDLGAVQGEIFGFKRGLNGGLKQAGYVLIGIIITFVATQVGLG